jgi:hypothetical protein
MNNDIILLNEFLYTIIGPPYVEEGTVKPDDAAEMVYFDAENLTRGGHFVFRQ